MRDNPLSPPYAKGMGRWRAEGVTEGDDSGESKSIVMLKMPPPHAEGVGRRNGDSIFVRLYFANVSAVSGLRSHT